jgi:hypothetical protein
MNKNKSYKWQLISSGILSVIFLGLTCVCMYFMASNIQLYREWAYWLMLPLAIVSALTFIVFAKWFSNVVIDLFIKDHYLVITNNNKKLMGYEIRLVDWHLFCIIEGDVTHYIDKKNVKSICVITRDNKKEVLSPYDFIKGMKEV